MEFLRILWQREELNLAVMEYSYSAWILLKPLDEAGINKQLLDLVESMSLSHCLGGEVLGELRLMSRTLEQRKTNSRSWNFRKHIRTDLSWFGFARPSVR